jgi:hypothetical protein
MNFDDESNNDWNRQKVLERLSMVTLPNNLQPTIGPDGITRIYVRALDFTESRVLFGTEDAVHPFWSPDSRHLAFAADLKLKRIDLAGGPPRVLATVIGPWHGSWGPDGTILYLGESGTVQIPADGGSVTPALEQDKRGPFQSGFPFFLPEGKRFLQWVGGSIKASGGIELDRLGGRQGKIILRDVTSAPILAPVPNGKVYLLYISDGTLMARAFDDKSGAVRGNAFAVVDQIGEVAHPPRLATVGVSSNGVLAYQNSAFEKSKMGGSTVREDRWASFRRLSAATILSCRPTGTSWRWRQPGIFGSPISRADHPPA